jgi:cytochrome c oxidase assembly protein subunit 15
VIGLVIWTRRALPRGHAARRAAVAALGLMVVEALLGAALVLFGWVAKDASPERGWVMAVHLTNTLLLLGALTFTASWAGAPAGPLPRGRGRVAGALALAALATLVASASGAIAALGDTLYPATTLGEALRQDLDASSRLLLRLRLLHPPAAVAAALAIAWASRFAASASPPGPVRRGAALAAVLALAQVGLGIANLALLAPVGMQLAHLALADLTWIALASLAARTLAPGGPALDAERRPAEGAARAAG